MMKVIVGGRSVDFSRKGAIDAWTVALGTRSTYGLDLIAFHVSLAAYRASEPVSLWYDQTND